ncbi:Guanine nucleotide exchange factor lte1 [Dimargaris cristalligena]|nr:Guanine nucleotide exchange factor lte1 [Dimargaris cristalligena]
MDALMAETPRPLPGKALDDMPAASENQPSSLVQDTDLAQLLSSFASVDGPSLSLNILDFSASSINDFPSADSPLSSLSHPFHVSPDHGASQFTHISRPPVAPRVVPRTTQSPSPPPDSLVLGTATSVTFSDLPPKPTVTALLPASTAPSKVVPPTAILLSGLASPPRLAREPTIPKLAASSLFPPTPTVSPSSSTAQIHIAQALLSPPLPISERLTITLRRPSAPEPNQSGITLASPRPNRPAATGTSPLQQPVPARKLSQSSSYKYNSLNVLPRPRPVPSARLSSMGQRRRLVKSYMSPNSPEFQRMARVLGWDKKNIFNQPLGLNDPPTEPMPPPPSLSRTTLPPGRYSTGWFSTRDSMASDSSLPPPPVGSLPQLPHIPFATGEFAATSADTHSGVRGSATMPLPRSHRKRSHFSKSSFGFRLKRGDSPSLHRRSMASSISDGSQTGPGKPLGALKTSGGVMGNLPATVETESVPTVELDDSTIFDRVANDDDRSCIVWSTSRAPDRSRDPATVYQIKPVRRPSVLHQLRARYRAMMHRTSGGDSSLSVPPTIPSYSSRHHRLTLIPDTQPTATPGNPRVIMAATLEKLIQKITTEVDYAFVSDFFLTYRDFLTPIQLCRLLFLRFDWATQQDDDSHKLVRIRLFIVLRFWLRNYFVLDFGPNQELRFTFTQCLHDIWTNPHCQDSPREARILIELEKIMQELATTHFRTLRARSLTPQLAVINDPKDRRAAEGSSYNLSHSILSAYGGTSSTSPDRHGSTSSVSLSQVSASDLEAHTWGPYFALLDRNLPAANELQNLNLGSHAAPLNLPANPNHSYFDVISKLQSTPSHLMKAAATAKLTDRESKVDPFFTSMTTGGLSANHLAPDRSNRLSQTYVPPAKVVPPPAVVVPPSQTTGPSAFPKLQDTIYHQPSPSLASTLAIRPVTSAPDLKISTVPLTQFNIQRMRQNSIRNRRLANCYCKQKYALNFYANKTEGRGTPTGSGSGRVSRKLSHTSQDISSGRWGSDWGAPGGTRGGNGSAGRSSSTSAAMGIGAGPASSAALAGPITTVSHYYSNPFDVSFFSAYPGGRKGGSRTPGFGLTDDDHRAPRSTRAFRNRSNRHPSGSTHLGQSSSMSIDGGPGYTPTSASFPKKMQHIFLGKRTARQRALRLLRKTNLYYRRQRFIVSYRRNHLHLQQQQMRAYQRYRRSLSLVHPVEIDISASETNKISNTTVPTAPTGPSKGTAMAGLSLSSPNIHPTVRKLSMADAAPSPPVVGRTARKPRSNSDTQHSLFSCSTESSSVSSSASMSPTATANSQRPHPSADRPKTNLVTRYFSLLLPHSSDQRSGTASPPPDPASNGNLSCENSGSSSSSSSISKGGYGSIPESPSHFHSYHSPQTTAVTPASSNTLTPASLSLSRFRLNSLTSKSSPLAAAQPDLDEAGKPIPPSRPRGFLNRWRQDDASSTSPKATGTDNRGSQSLDTLPVLAVSFSDGVKPPADQLCQSLDPLEQQPRQKQRPIPPPRPHFPAIEADRRSLDSIQPASALQSSILDTPTISFADFEPAPTVRLTSVGGPATYFPNGRCPSPVNLALASGSGPTVAAASCRNLPAAVPAATKPSAKPSTPSPRQGNPDDLDSQRSCILYFRSELIAQQLCIMECEILQRVSWQDLIELRWQKKKRAAPPPANPTSTEAGQSTGVGASRTTSHSSLGSTPGAGPDPIGNDCGVSQVIRRFDQMSQWAVTEIIRTLDIQERVLVVEKFIRVALKCYHHANFSTLMQILFALQSSPVHRLKQTWSLIGDYEYHMFQYLKDFACPTRNWKNLRDATKVMLECGCGNDLGEMRICPTCSRASLTLQDNPRTVTEVYERYQIGGCVPFLGLFLSDLVMNAELPTFVRPRPLSTASASSSHTNGTTTTSTTTRGSSSTSTSASTSSPGGGEGGLAVPAPARLMVNFHKLRNSAGIIKRLIAFQTVLAHRYPFTKDPLVYSLLSDNLEVWDEKTVMANSCKLE